MRPEGASILSARCEIREIPLTVTSKTDSTLYSTSKTRPSRAQRRSTAAHDSRADNCSLVTRRPAFAAFRLPRFTRAIVPRGWRSRGGAAPRGPRPRAPGRARGDAPGRARGRPGAHGRDAHRAQSFRLDSLRLQYNRTSDEEIRKPKYALR